MKSVRPSSVALRKANPNPKDFKKALRKLEMEELKAGGRRREGDHVKKKDE